MMTHSKKVRFIEEIIEKAIKIDTGQEVTVVEFKRETPFVIGLKVVWGCDGQCVYLAWDTSMYAGQNLNRLYKKSGLKFTGA